MEIVIGIIVFILILGLIVLIHEGGHFFFAKRAGILCYEFSIGMGPALYQKKVGETLYSIRLIPIGGYVSMAGEEIESTPLNGMKYAKVKCDEQSKVVEIYALKDKTEKYIKNINPDEFYEIKEFNLIGTKDEIENELFIVLSIDGEDVKYFVNKDAIVRFDKKMTIQIAPYNRLFVNKSLLQRFLAVVAGPFMNFVLAFLVFFIMGICTGYADTNKKNTFIDSIEESTPAYNAGLRSGDRILSINNDSNLSKWTDISSKLNSMALGEDFNGSVTVKVKRDNQELEFVVSPIVYIQSAYLYFKADGTNSLEVGAFPNNNEEMPTFKAGLRENDILKSVINERGEEHVFKDRADCLAYFNTGVGANSEEFTFTVERSGEIVTLEKFTTYKRKIFVDQGVEVSKVLLGISPGITRNIGKLLLEPFKSVGSSCLVIFKTLGALFTKDSGLSIKDLSGPVGIAEATVSLVGQGVIPIFNWLAILSVNIGFMNILPLPALDGGRLAFLGYEAITKRKTNPKVENWIHTIGLLLLLALFVFVGLNDVIKWIK